MESCRRDAQWNALQKGHTIESSVPSQMMMLLLDNDLGTGELAVGKLAAGELVQASWPWTSWHGQVARDPSPMKPACASRISRGGLLIIPPSATHTNEPTSYINSSAKAGLESKHAPEARSRKGP